ncbi:hypothetical protein ACF1A9_12675 [Streptomyces sp. NPDC014872]|uniref:hypothetical protein n=1 Tax=Streptomyces sp. NPDC014872 TaxID=3364926 RepID=UPI0036FE1F9F
MPARIADMTARLVPVPGARAVSLVGSRVRGTHRPDSDRDPGVCCRGFPDVAARVGEVVRGLDPAAGKARTARNAGKAWTAGRARTAEGPGP